MSTDNGAPTDSDSEIYKEYKKEASEILNRLRSACEGLTGRLDKGALTEIAESSHKIKGVAGMMDYSHISELADELEKVSKLLIKEKIQVNSGITATVLESVDLLAKYIETDYDERDVTLLEKLKLASNESS